MNLTQRYNRIPKPYFRGPNYVNYSIKVSHIYATVMLQYIKKWIYRFDIDNIKSYQPPQY